MRTFRITIDIAAPARRVWEVMSDTDRWHEWTPSVRVVARHSVESTDTGSRATLSLDLQGPFGGLLGRMTRETTERYLGFEAQGLKARSEDPAFRAQGDDPTPAAGHPPRTVSP